MRISLIIVRHLQTCIFGAVPEGLNNLMISQLITAAFNDMVEGMSKVVIPTEVPHLYHASATPHEANSVYHFTKAVEQRSKHSAVYLEYQCDSGRVDAVIVTETAWLLVEAKSYLNVGKLHSLEAQATRLGDGNDSLRRYLSDRIPRFKKQKWGLETQDQIWGVLLAETCEERWKTFWQALSTNQEYATLKTYTHVEKRNPIFQARPWWHLLAFKQVV